MPMVFPTPEIISLPIVNSNDAVPVRRIYCVGQNYATHAKEMGANAQQDSPFFFTKHALDVALSGQTIGYPTGTNNLHYELELVVIVGKKLFKANTEAAKEAIWGYAVGLDLTRRDLQQNLRRQSLPWALSKSFHQSVIISAVNTAVDKSALDSQTLVLKQNGEIKQQALIGDMIRNSETLLAYLSQLDTLYPGDLLFTGTPAGVGAITKGDQLYGEITGVGEVSVNFAAD